VSEKWYYMVDRNKIGPVTREQILILLRRRVLKGQTPVWNSSLPRYVPLETLEDLAPFVPDVDEGMVDLEPAEPPPLKGFTRFLLPKVGKEEVAELTKSNSKPPFERPHQLEDEPDSPSLTRPPIPGAPEGKKPKPRPSSPKKDKDSQSVSAVKQVTGAVSEGMRLLGASALSIGAALFGIFVLGLIDLLIGGHRDMFYEGMAILIPHEFLTLLDPVEWMGVLIVGGLVGSAASAGCGGRGNAAIAGIAAGCAFFSVFVGAIFAEILAESIATVTPLPEMVLDPEAWFMGLGAFWVNLTEEPDDLLFLFGAAGEAFLIARHNYRRHEDEEAKRVVDPFLKT